MKVASSRRRLIVTVLLVLAVGGALLRWRAPAGSTAYDVGTLLLVMWVPAVGQIIGYVLRRRAERRARPMAAPGTPFAAHVRAALQWTAQRPAPGEHACLLVIGSQGFSARARLASNGEDDAVEIEFLAPQAALPHFAADVVFSLVRGRTVVARGKVVDAALPRGRAV